MHASPIVRTLQNANSLAQHHKNESQHHSIKNEALILSYTDHDTNSEDNVIEPDQIQAQYRSPTDDSKKL